MKVLFLCGCLEPGRDGVGDYTAELAAQLVSQGHGVSAIALNDHFVNNVFRGTITRKDISLPVLRLPANSNAEDRYNLAKEWVEFYNPDWLSLQFVIYAYHPKGFPFGLGKLLAGIGKGRKWHIMFHEIWVGISKMSPLKHKITGFFQKRIISSIINSLKPNLITTSNLLYQLVLKDYNINSVILPLFSNIPFVLNSTSILPGILKNLNLTKPEQLKEWRLTGIFGNLYPEAMLEGVLMEQLHIAGEQSLNLAFISFGRISEWGMLEFKRLETKFHDQIKFICMGEQSPQNVSGLMQVLDAGISCTPLQHIGKSGVFAAMKLHGLDVIMSAEENIPEYGEAINSYHKQLIKRKPEEWSVESVSEQFIDALLVRPDINH